MKITNLYHKKTSITVFVALVLTGVAFAINPASGKSFNAQSGKSTKLNGYTSWNSDCSYKQVVIDVIGKPKHGKVTPKLGSGKISTVLSGSSKCKGRTIKKVFLYYTSKSGYEGSDSFKIRVRFSTGPQTFNYRINVR